MTVSTLSPTEIQLIYAQLTLSVASAIMAYQVTAKIVDRIAANHLGFEHVRIHIIIIGVSLVWSVSLILPISTFLSLCVASVALTLLNLRKTTSASKEIPLAPFMTDLVEAAKEKVECYTAGHEKYIRELEVVLRQREKNNGVLVGPAGVGKSAIFETIAWMVAHNKFPANSPFYKKRIVGVDMGNIIADATYVGTKEARVKKMIELAKADPSVIYVIDEMHRLVGAGISMHNQTNDVANQLKPALARPEIRVLGATTPAEYTQYILRDATLDRRFKKIDVSVPTPRECLGMLMSRKAQGYYTLYNANLTIADDALKAAVFFTARDIPNRSFPDKANDIIDSVCTRAMMRQAESEQIEVTVQDIVHEHALLVRISAADLIRQFELVNSNGALFQAETL